MARALDEPDALYGVVRPVAVRWSGDGLTYRFLLRPEARFHDGSKLTARDVAFSLRCLERTWAPAHRPDDSADDLRGRRRRRQVVVTFAPERSRDLPLTIASLPVFSEDYYRNRDFEASTLEAPLGSGPLRVGRFEVGRFIEFERVTDHWARDLPVAIGHNNFDRIRYEYYRDRASPSKAFKAGEFTYPRGVHLEDLGDGLRFRGDQGQARQAGGDARRDALRNARLVAQHPAREVPRSARARSGRPRVRFRVDQPNLMYGTYRRAASFFENSA